MRKFNYQNNLPSLYFKSTSGHRTNYINIFSDYFDNILLFQNSSFFFRLRKLIKPSKLFFGMIDDGYFEFFIISIIRLIFIKETSGIFVRPQTCFKLNFLSVTKLLLFSFFSRLPKVNIYSLLPYYCFPKMKYVCSDFIYDPELWHLSKNKEIYSLEKLVFEETAPFKNNVVKPFLNVPNSLSQKSPTILMCGLISTYKGSQDLCNIVLAGKLIESGWRVILAGKTPSHDESHKVRLKLESIGCINFDRYIEDKELKHLYNISDYIWCSYDLIYDQSSGIFGNAIQRSKVPIIRSGTMIEKFAEYNSIDHIKMCTDSSLKNAQRLQNAYDNKIVQRGNVFSDSWRCDFEKKLGLKPFE